MRSDAGRLYHHGALQIRIEKAQLRLWARRTAAFAVWLLLIQHYRGALHLGAAEEWIPLSILTAARAHRTLATLAGAAIGLMAVAAIGVGRAFSMVLYVLSWPLWAPPLVLVSLSRVARWLWPGRALVRALRWILNDSLSGGARAIYVVVGGACGTAIFLASDPVILEPAVVLILITTLALLASAFTASPVTSLSRKALNWVKLTLANAERFIFPEDQEERAPADQTQRSSENLGRALKIYGWLVSKLEVGTSVKFTVAAFSGVFVLALLIVVAGFGFAYLGLSKLQPEAFGCSARAPGLLDALFFSLTTLTTADGSPFCPQARSAQGLVALQLLSGICLLTLLVLTFSSLHVEDVTRTREDWQETVGIVGRKVAHWQQLVTAAGAAVAEPRGAPVEQLREHVGQQQSAGEKWAAQLLRRLEAAQPPRPPG